MHTPVRAKNILSSKMYNIKQRCKRCIPGRYRRLSLDSEGAWEQSAMQDKVLVLRSRKPTTPLYTFTCNVPTPLTSLIGRDQEVAAAYDLLLLPEGGLGTVAGPGCGATTHPTP